MHLVNRRLIAFREALRDCSGPELPEPITPELLIRGYNLLSTNIVPSLQSVSADDFDPDVDYDPVDSVHDTYAKLRKIRANLVEIYNSEFIAQLIYQATNEKSRYKPVSHVGIDVGDVVLLRESNTKPSNYPMGIVSSIHRNDLGEVTGAIIRKGVSGELVKRHSSAIIPLLRVQEHSNPLDPPTDAAVAPNSADLPCSRVPARPDRRSAAIVSEQRSRSMLNL